jgi:hypothetical protein
MALGLIFEAVKYLDQQLGLLRGLKNRLTRDEQKAAQDLDRVLDEVMKVYRAIDNELGLYLGLDLTDDEDRRAARAELLRLERQPLGERLQSARGHCHKIANIYNRDLTTWIDNVVKGQEAQSLHEVFRYLTLYDLQMLQQIDELVGWLVPRASETLTFLDQGDVERAAALVRSSRLEALPVSQAIAELAQKVRQAQTEFIQAAGVV